METKVIEIVLTVREKSSGDTLHGQIVGYNGDVEKAKLHYTEVLNKLNELSNGRQVNPVQIERGFQSLFDPF